MSQCEIFPSNPFLSFPIFNESDLKNVEFFSVGNQPIYFFSKLFIMETDFLGSLEKNLTISAEKSVSERR